MCCCLARGAPLFSAVLGAVLVRGVDRAADVREELKAVDAGSGMLSGGLLWRSVGHEWQWWTFGPVGRL